VFLLDSDHLTILWYNQGEQYDALIERLDRHSSADMFVSIVTIDEQLRGWLAYIAKSSQVDGVVNGYRKLREVIQRFAEIQVIDFDYASAEVFNELRSQKVRVGTMDLRIASIAIANDLVLLTRNTVDFERVPNLKFEDWTFRQ
jgi:tRNA(fMet)-specific endonuclease VapC